MQLRWLDIVVPFTNIEMNPCIIWEELVDQGESMGKRKGEGQPMVQILEVAPNYVKSQIKS